jgi:hypothetical protein
MTHTFLNPVTHNKIKTQKLSIYNTNTTYLTTAATGTYILNILVKHTRTHKHKHKSHQSSHTPPPQNALRSPFTTGPAARALRTPQRRARTHDIRAAQHLRPAHSPPRMRSRSRSIPCTPHTSARSLVARAAHPHYSTRRTPNPNRWTRARRHHRESSSGSSTSISPGPRATRTRCLLVA